ncbi:hypothetical protein C7446_2584 [Kushneria sinocarnis]|uniref:Uncharacterized protein n=1 Tax=Kushneria sinocarnis TaxID=595502 RepID=A0A420WUR0_9GAMM|nr:hypothetical protein [Kushneria sinocarnis]RKQ97164.1 hypothetical protein C7446_2584 [Kushneria sinocarnis]
MADDTTVDQQQLQATLNEAWQKVRDIIKAQLGTIQIGENQALGVLSTIDTLAEAPVGDQATLLQTIGLGMLTDAINGEASDVRSALGLGALAQLAQLSDAKVGDGNALVSAIIEAMTNGNADFRTLLGLGSAATYSDSRYPKLSGGAAANFGAMPRVDGAYIIETGTTQNGRYTKFSDRTLICTIDKYVCAALDGYRFGGLWGFPAMFALPPSLSYSFISPTGSVNDPFSGTGLSTYNSIFLTSSLSEATASLRIWYAGGDAETSDTITVTMTATGYWK